MKSAVYCLHLNASNGEAVRDLLMIDLLRSWYCDRDLDLHLTELLHSQDFTQSAKTTGRNCIFRRFCGSLADILTMEVHANAKLDDVPIHFSPPSFL